LPARLRGRQTGGRSMRKAWLAGLGLLLLPAVPVRGDEWTHQYALKGRPELHVTTDDGSVQIEASDRREIGARVTTRGWRLGPDEVVVTESQAGDRVDIEVRVPHDNWGMNFGHREIKVTLQVPREADLDIRTGDGSVSVQPVSGRLRIFSGDGGITLRLPDDLSAELDAHTGDGHITLDFPVTVAGSISTSSVRGKLGAGGPPLRVQTGDGSIHLQRL